MCLGLTGGNYRRDPRRARISPFRVVSRVPRGKVQVRLNNRLRICRWIIHSARYPTTLSLRRNFSTSSRNGVRFKFPDDVNSEKFIDII